MLFSTTLTVPAATAASSPAEAELDVEAGIIHRVDFAFLDGPENEVRVALRSAGTHQIAPTNKGYIVGNDETVPCHLHYALEEPPFKVVLQGWSPDATYSHEISVRVHILPREDLEGSQEGIGLLRRLTRAIFGGS